MAAGLCAGAAAQDIAPPGMQEPAAQSPALAPDTLPPAELPQAQREDPAGTPIARDDEEQAEFPAEPIAVAPDAGVDPTTLPRDLSPWGMFVEADIVVKAVMIGLAFASLVSWSIAIKKALEIAAAKAFARRAFAQLRASGSLHEALGKLKGRRGVVPEFTAAAAEELAASRDLVGAGFVSGIKERIAASLLRLEAAAGRRASRATGLLATIGSTAPFVGLFGTVWGIMNAFVGISEAQTTNLAVVAPGIAEALLATALGLVAAIPAVVFYNAFARSIAAYRAVLADASTEVQRIASRDLDRELKPMRAAA